VQKTIHFLLIFQDLPFDSSGQKFIIYSADLWIKYCTNKHYFCVAYIIIQLVFIIKAHYSLRGTNWIFVQCRLIWVLNLLWQSALRQVFPRAPQFSSVITFPPILLAHYRVNKYSYQKEKRERPGTCQKKSPHECVISCFRPNHVLRLSGMLTRRLMVISCRRFGTLCPNFKDQADWRWDL